MSDKPEYVIDRYSLTETDGRVATQREDGFLESIWFRSAYDHSYWGISGMTMGFVLIGPKGSVEWELLTGCYLDETLQQLKEENQGTALGPTAGPIWMHHRHRPEWGSENGHTTECMWNQGECWSDVGYGIGQTAYERLTQDGVRGLWKWLEELHGDLTDG